MDEKQALISGLSVSDVASYLTGNGWQCVASSSIRAVYSHSNSSPPGQVVLPLDQGARTFRLILLQLIQDLSQSEGRSELETIRRIASQGSDIVKIRLSSDDTSGGSLPLQVGPELILDARNMILASAQSTEDRRPSHAAARTDRVREYMNRARMGQTEFGSYVITFLSPVPPELTDQSGQLSLGPEVDQPFARSVTLNLMTALYAAKEAIQASALASSDKFTPFVQSVGSGVSANLLHSLSSILDSEPIGEATVSVDWSAVRAKPSIPADSVTFSKKDSFILRAAEGELRSRSPQPDQQIEGFVVGLESDGEESEHTVTVRTRDDGKDRRVRFSLNSTDYLAAIHAHESHLTVQCKGQLTKEGTRWRLLNPRQFQVIEIKDLGLD